MCDFRDLCDFIHYQNRQIATTADLYAACPQAAFAFQPWQITTTAGLVRPVPVAGLPVPVSRMSSFFDSHVIIPRPAKLSCARGT